MANGYSPNFGGTGYRHLQPVDAEESSQRVGPHHAALGIAATTHGRRSGGWSRPWPMTHCTSVAPVVNRENSPSWFEAVQGGFDG